RRSSDLRAGGLGNVVGYPFIALGADADGPFQRGADADPFLPVGINLGKIVGEVERRARTVGTMDHGDGLVGQSKAGVELCDGGIVPAGDLAQEDVAERRTV